MTEQEKRVLDALAEAWRAYIELPILGEAKEAADDRKDFWHYIVSAERIVKYHVHQGRNK